MADAAPDIRDDELVKVCEDAASHLLELHKTDKGVCSLAEKVFKVSGDPQNAGDIRSMESIQKRSI